MWVAFCQVKADTAVAVDTQSDNTAKAQDATSNTTTQTADKPRPPSIRRRPPPVPKPKESAKVVQPDETDSSVTKPAENSIDIAPQTTVSKPAETSAEDGSQTAVQASKSSKRPRKQKSRPALPKRTVKSVLVVPRGGLHMERPPTPSPNKPIPPPPSKPCPARPTVVKAADPPVVEKKEDVEMAPKPTSPSVERIDPTKSNDEVDNVTTSKPTPPLKPKPKLLPKPKVLPKPKILPKPKWDPKNSQVESKETKPVLSPQSQPSELPKKDAQGPVPAPRKKKPSAPQRTTSLSAADNAAKIPGTRDSPDGAEDVKADKKTVGTSSHPKRPPPRPPVSKKLMEKQETLKKVDVPAADAESTKKDTTLEQKPESSTEPKVLFDLSQQPQESKNPRQEQGRSSFFKSLKKMVQKSGPSDSGTSDNQENASVPDLGKDSSQSSKAEVNKKQPEKTTDVKEVPVLKVRSLTTPTKPAGGADSSDGGSNTRPPKPNKPVPQLPALKTISETLEKSLTEPERKTDDVATDRPQVPKRRKKSTSPEAEPPASSPVKSPSVKPKPERPPPPKFNSPKDPVKDTIKTEDPVKPEVIPRAHTTSSKADVEQETHVKLRRARCSYIAKKTGELSFNKGDILTEMEPKNKNGMCYGMLDNGTSGFYQAKFVELFTPTY